ncbi:hypothetical protein CSKR_112232 [Clonorchis sinensis]|uniref:Uncharacterized protein n=1 Tax=Clonorchis sinensis TaxID=79923 RepID=A0A3R7CGK7_CLOSI|nr:hypothetical protein CSKR_112232 [Clonorchis sinensis]
MRKFHIGDTVYAGSFQGPEEWSSGTVLGKKGNEIHEISVGKENWTRHINQLRPNHMHSQYQQGEENFQWDIFLIHSLRPTGKRKRSGWLQVNPKRKNYDQIRAVRKQFQFEKRGNAAEHQPNAKPNNHVVKQCRTGTTPRLNQVRFHLVSE